MMETIVVQGHRGILGAALLAHIRSQIPTVQVAVADVRLDHLGDREIELRSLIPSDQSGPLLWVCAAGLVDPKLPVAELDAANVTLPIGVLDGLCRIKEEGGVQAITFVTFGSALETRNALIAGNAYLSSKNRLNLHWHRTADRLPVNWQHVQLHTLYGGSRAHPFMFLGQMQAALRDQSPFLMSSGRQLREYHHVDDVVSNVLAYLRRDENLPRCFDLSSGLPVSLEKLATNVFAAFDATQLLRIGSVPGASGEVFTPEFQRSPYLTTYRDPVAGVIAWLSELEGR